MERGEGKPKRSSYIWRVGQGSFVLRGKGGFKRGRSVPAVGSVVQEEDSDGAGHRIVNVYGDLLPRTAGMGG